MKIINDVIVVCNKYDIDEMECKETIDGSL